jgi:hypothetical protein
VRTKQDALKAISALMDVLWAAVAEMESVDTDFADAAIDIIGKASKRRLTQIQAKRQGGGVA